MSVAAQPSTPSSELERIAADAREVSRGLWREMTVQGVAEGARSLLADYIGKLLHDRPRYRTYTHVAVQTAVLREEIAGRVPGPRVIERFHRLLCCALIEAFPRNVASEMLPASVLALYGAQLERILTAVVEEPLESFDYANDLFTKDVCLASFRLLPTGARVVDPNGGLPRSVLLKQAPSPLVRG